jgi:hypothetical protein
LAFGTITPSFKPQGGAHRAGGAADFSVARFRHGRHLDLPRRHAHRPNTSSLLRANIPRPWLMEFRQRFEPPEPDGPRQADMLATMPDGSALRLPLRNYGAIGVGGFIANQASFAVTGQLAQWMAERARPFAAKVVVGLPTLGHVFGPLVAEALGYANWVAPGYSRKL